MAIDEKTKDTAINFDTITTLTNTLDLLIQQLVADLKSDFNLD
jgi:hypothetical protein